MKAIIISVGDELITGKTIDTNSAYLGSKLGEKGIVVLGFHTVGDDVAQIARAITEGARRAQVVLITGGLGPTQDDLTREALAQAMHRELTLDERSLSELEEYFAQRGREMAAINRMQAMIPTGCEPIPNPRGTAPGIAGTLDESTIFALPGVPQEMQAMFADSIFPRLGDGDAIVLHRVVHTFGLGESAIATRLADLMDRSGNPTIGTAAGAGLVSIHITSRAPDRETAEREAREVVEEIRRRCGDLVFGEGDQSMSSAVGRLLRDSKSTLAIAESCTGGLLAAMITEVPGASEYFLGGVVAYSNEVKQRSLGVPEALIAAHGAVSVEVARAMSEGCRETFGSDYTLSITGIAGPTAPDSSKPIGLVYIALGSEDATEVHEHRMGGTRPMVTMRSAMQAMNYLRLKLISKIP